jgi:hypothetical protein
LDEIGALQVRVKNRCVDRHDERSTREKYTAVLATIGAWPHGRHLPKAFFVQPMVGAHQPKLKYNP